MKTLLYVFKYEASSVKIIIKKSFKVMLILQFLNSLFSWFQPALSLGQPIGGFPNKSLFKIALLNP